MSTAQRILGRVRMLRGRCPACSSEAPAASGCRVCLGYQGPFPPAEDALQRWSARFDRRIALAPPPARQGAAHVLTPVR